MTLFRAFAEAEISDFIATLDRSQDFSCTGRSLYDAYRRWRRPGDAVIRTSAGDFHMNPLTETMFGRLMKDRVPSRRLASGIHYIGVRLPEG